MIPRPPRGAIRLLKIFVPPASAEPVLGDLGEEFAVRAGSGPAAAYRWYWRQTLLTIPHLVWSSLRAAPWSTAALVFGSLVVAGIADLAVRTTAELMLTTMNPDDYVSGIWLWRTHDAVRYVGVPIALGWSIAAAPRGKEMGVVTVVAALLIAGFIWNLTVIAQRGISLGVLWQRPLFYHVVHMGTTFPLCLLAGGLLARFQQSRAALNDR